MILQKKEELANRQLRLTITVERDAWEKALNDAYQEVKALYPVEGYAVGKAPREALEKAYSHDLFYQEAVNETFPAALVEAIASEDIQIAAPPALNVETIGPDGYTFTALIDLYPEVKLGQYKGLSAPWENAELSDDDTNEAIQRFLTEHLVEQEQDRAAMGDEVTLDFEGFVDGVPFEGGKGEGYPLLLGSGMFIPGFEEQVVGHKAGEEFDVNVKFPEEYQAEELAGKDATFKIKLHEVQYKELPELDDDFAKDVSEYDTLDELKDSIRKGIETNHEKQADQKVENDLIDQVVGGMKAEIPDAMIESRIEELVQDFQYRISQQGLKLEQYLQYMGMTMEQFKEQFREQADKQVKMRLAMEAIVAKESIEATEEEFEAEIKRIADAYQMEADKVKSLVDAAAVKKDLAVNKAIDFVKSKANIVAGAAEEKKPAKKTTRKTTKKAAAKQDEEPKEEETKGE